MTSIGSISATATQYDQKTIWLHWLTAIFVFSLWIVAHMIDWFPRGTPRVLVRSLHISAGALLGFVLVYRIWWRLFYGARLAPVATGIQQSLAKGMHLLLYITVIATVVIGIATTWVRGDNLFGLFSIPAFDPGNKELRGSVKDLHELFANILLVLALAHAAIAVIHHVVFKDGVLRRMMSGRSGT